MPTIAAMQTSAQFARASAFGAAARQFGARSPSGALLRHSPGRTHPPLAQLQFPRFLRPDRAYDPENDTGFPKDHTPAKKLTGVTRFDLSQVYRAPRRPVLVPAERWPGAARERMANPPAGTAPAPLFRHAFRKGALDERGDGHVTEMGTDVKWLRHIMSDLVLLLALRLGCGLINLPPISPFGETRTQSRCRRMTEFDPQATLAIGQPQLHVLKATPASFCA